MPTAGGPGSLPVPPEGSSCMPASEDSLECGFPAREPQLPSLQGLSRRPSWCKGVRGAEGGVLEGVLLLPF